MILWGKTVSLGVVLLVAGALFASGIYVARFRSDAKADSEASAEIAKDTKASEKWERQMEALTLAVAKLSEAQADLLATKYNRPDVRVIPGPPGRDGAPGEPGRPGTSVLAETSTETPAPAGVDILTTVDKSGKVENTVVARPVRFWGAPLKARWFAEGLWSEANMDSLTIRGGLEFDLVRAGWLHVQPKIEGFREPLLGVPGEFDTGVRGGVRFTFERN